MATQTRARFNRNEPKGKAKDQGKFDENEFFRHLREDPNAASLLRLLRSLDKRAALEIVSYALGYLMPWKERPPELELSKRGAKVKRALAAVIPALRKAAAKYRDVAAIEFPVAGSLVTARQHSWLQGYPPVAEVLEAEAERFSELLQDCKKLYNQKRMGLSGRHLWLVRLEEFVSAWTLRELGERRPIRPDEIAALITSCRLTMGWDVKRSLAQPDLIRKAIRKFRSNPCNELLVEIAAKLPAAERCQRIACSRHPPQGIEI